MNVPTAAQPESSCTPSVSHGLGPRPLRIGPLTVDPPVLQAPMAGYTNYAFRQIVRDYGGVGLQATEMISAQLRLARPAGLRTPGPVVGYPRRASSLGRADLG